MSFGSGIARPSRAASSSTLLAESRSSIWARSAEFSVSSSSICSESRPEPALRLRLITLRATIPPSSAQSTAIQPRPRVSRKIRPESERSRTAPALRAAPPAGAGRRRPSRGSDQRVPLGRTWRPAGALAGVAGVGAAGRATAGAGRAERPGAVRLRALAAAAISPCSSRILRAARRWAEEERGLRSISSGPGAIARLVSSSASGSRPQTQTGSSGGQTQPRARSARKRFTRRSSSEWKEIAPSRPPTAGPPRRAAARGRARRARR